MVMVGVMDAVAVDSNPLGGENPLSPPELKIEGENK